MDSSGFSYCPSLNLNSIRNQFHSWPWRDFNLCQNRDICNTYCWIQWLWLKRCTWVQSVTIGVRTCHWFAFPISPHPDTEHPQEEKKNTQHWFEYVSCQTFDCYDASGLYRAPCKSTQDNNLEREPSWLVMWHSEAMIVSRLLRGLILSIRTVCLCACACV